MQSKQINLNKLINMIHQRLQITREDMGQVHNKIEGCITTNVQM